MIICIFSSIFLCSPCNQTDDRMKKQSKDEEFEVLRVAKSRRRACRESDERRCIVLVKCELREGRWYSNLVDFRDSTMLLGLKLSAFGFVGL